MPFNSTLTMARLPFSKLAIQGIDWRICRLAGEHNDLAVAVQFNPRDFAAAPANGPY
jgi:hypothetical protein